MKLLLLSLALFELLLCHKGSAQFLEENCGYSNYHKLITHYSHHNQALTDSTPWMAAVTNYDGFLCGGSLITKDFVLTAAHCIDGQRHLFVQLGIYDRSCVTRRCRGVEYFNVARAIIHPGYESNHYTNDIALLKLHAEVQYNHQIHPLCIVTVDWLNLQNSDHFTAFGWKPEHAGQPLIATPLFRRVSEGCRPGNITDKQICAGSAMGDTCHGDSGGPMGVYFLNLYVQMGVVGYGARACNVSGIYTNVASYKDWIVTNVRSVYQADTSYPGIREEEHRSEADDSGDVRLLYEGCGGVEPALRNQSWQVTSLSNTFTGSLITDRFVVTAAYGLITYQSSKDNPLILKTSWDERLNVDSIIEHPQFRNEMWSAGNDIALLRLDRRVQFTAIFKPICVGLNFDPARSFFYRNQEISPLMCANRLEGPLDHRQICSRGERLMAGSPLFAAEEIRGINEESLIGIFSFAVQNVTVFTNVQSHVSWIKETINHNLK